MKNEYGVALDRNKYAPSVISQAERCYLCGRASGRLERHEVWHGSRREKSKMLGCWVNLCQDCHDRLHHVGGGLDDGLKRKAQAVVMEHYGWDESDFRRVFGKSYL